MPGSPASRETVALRFDEDPDRFLMRRRRIGYTLTSAALAVLMGFAVVDGVGVVDAFGVDTAHVRAEGGGYELDVRYATVSRPALATPFYIEVRRPGGFEGPVTLSVSAAYLALWDENGLAPAPSEETSTATETVWTFEPPEVGDVLHVSFDARIEPAAQSGRRGRVAILDHEGIAVAAVSFRTRVLP